MLVKLLLMKKELLIIFLSIQNMYMFSNKLAKIRKIGIRIHKFFKKTSLCHKLGCFVLKSIKSFE